MKNKLFKNSIIALVLTVLVALTGCSGGSNNSDTEGDNNKGDDKAITKNEDTVFEIKFAHVVRPTTPKGGAAEEFKKLVEEKSDGRILVTIYPDSQMGNDQEINEQIYSGSLDMNAPFLSTVTSFVPELEAFDLPYIFENYDQAYDALTGEVGDMYNTYLNEKG